MGEGEKYIGDEAGFFLHSEDLLADVLRQGGEIRDRETADGLGGHRLVSGSEEMAAGREPAVDGDQGAVDIGGAVGDQKGGEIGDCGGGWFEQPRAWRGAQSHPNPNPNPNPNP